MSGFHQGFPWTPPYQGPLGDTSSGGGGGSDAPVQLSVPVGFNWAPPFNLFRTPKSAVYSTDFNINSYQPAVAKQYFVASNGSDGNAGTLASPFGTFAHAITRVDVDQVVIIPAGTVAANGASILWGSRAWNGSVNSRSVSVVVNGGGRIVMAQTNGTAAPTWTKTSGLTNTYQTARAGTRVNGTMDLKYLDGNGDFVMTQLAASSAAVDATPNSYFDDGSSFIYVQASDSRNLVGDPYMTSGYQAQQGAFNASAAITLWVSNIDFVGGQPFSGAQAAAPTGAIPNLYLLNCSFQGSNYSGDGITLNGQYNVFFQQCSFTNNYDDGIGFHVANGVSSFVFENNCRTGYNGYAAGGSNQSSSWHDSTIGITLNPYYLGPENQTIRDITNTQRWSLGGQYFAPLATDLNGQTYSLTNTSQHWIDGTIIHPAGTFTLDIENTAVLHWRNCVPGLDTLTKTAGTGTLVPY